MTRLFLCLLALLSLSFDTQAAGRFQADCFDVAVVGRLAEQVTLPHAPDPEEILPDALFRMRFMVEQHFAPDATERWLQVQVLQHVGFSPAIRHYLILARRGEAGEFGLAGLSAAVVREADGKFVLPISRLTDGALPGQPPVAGLVQIAPVRTIRYSAEQAWWLGQKQRRSAQLVEEPGLTVHDMVAALSAARCDTAGAMRKR